MIMQLVEEGRLSLQTTLDRFYPAIPNANIITIQDMLSHKSGIHDFTQNATSEDWDTHLEEPLTHELMARIIAQYPPDFEPSTDFRYSNSNYLLLGYIIEAMDGNLYEASLANRISARIGLTSTYFGVGALDSIDNKGFSYQYNKGWKDILNNVLNIYHGKPFAVSMNRTLQALLIFGVGLLFFLTVKFRFKKAIRTESILSLGWVVAVLFWVGRYGLPF